MIVRCISNTGQGLIKVTTDFGYTVDTKFDFEIGSIYTVYGISSIEGRWGYLFSKKTDEWPGWWPAELFEVIDKYLLPIFYSDIRLRENYKEGENIFAIFGYKEMVFDLWHYDKLNDRHHDVLEIFFKRKSEIDELEEARKNRLRSL